MTETAPDLCAYLTVPAAIAYTSLSKDTLYRAMARGELSYSKIGTCRRISRQALDAFMAAHRAGRVEAPSVA